MTTPSDAQLLVFGKLTSFYASAEAGIKITLAGLLDIELTDLMILTEPCSSADLRNVAKSIAKKHYDPGKDLDRFCQIVGDLGAFGPLRNAIAHSRWTRGVRPDSIKPFRVDIRSGSAKFLGKDDEERDWTLPELEAQAEKARQLNTRIIQFMQDTGILAHMEAKQAASMAEIE